jgi:hypothetical protein
MGKVLWRFAGLPARKWRGENGLVPAFAPPAGDAAGAWTASSLWEVDPQTDQLVGVVLDRKGYLSDGVYYPDGVAVGAENVWVAAASGAGLRIDPVTHVKRRFESPRVWCSL